MYLGTILGIFCTFFRSTISRFLCFNFLLKRYKPFVVSNRSDVNAPELLLVTITSLFLEKFRRETWNKLQLLVIKKIQIFSSKITHFFVFFMYFAGNFVGKWTPMHLPLERACFWVNKISIKFHEILYLFQEKTCFWNTSCIIFHRVWNYIKSSW